MQENIKYAMIWRECKIRKTNQKKVKIQMRKKQWKILCGTVLLFFTFSSFAYPAEAEIPSDSSGTVSETEIWEATPEPQEPPEPQETAGTAGVVGTAGTGERAFRGGTAGAG